MNRFLLAAFILIFPVAGYWLLQTGKNHFRPLSFYGPKKLNGGFHFVRGVKIPDTVYYTVPDFTLMNQDSQIFSQSLLDTNTIYVAHFFYTRCTHLCPQVDESIDSLVNKFKIHPDVKFLSISLDPENDKPSVLKSYAKKLKANLNQWYFLTGNLAEVNSLARNSFFLNALPKDRDSVIAHSPLLVLVDSKHRIRGYYDGTREEEIKKLRDEIIVLRLEVLRRVTDIIQH